MPKLALAFVALTAFVSLVSATVARAMEMGRGTAGYVARGTYTAACDGQGWSIRFAPISAKTGLAMNRFRVAAAGALLSATMVGFGPAQAMEIQKFDKMAIDDQAEYAGLLSQGAEKVLTDEGKADQAKKVENLFTTNAPDGNTSIGMSQFMLDLAKARLADAQRALKDPKARRLEVEDAMFVTLKKNKIDLPDSFFTVLRNFHPKFPPQKP